MILSKLSFEAIIEEYDYSYNRKEYVEANYSIEDIEDYESQSDLDNVYDYIVQENWDEYISWLRDAHEDALDKKSSCYYE